MRNTIDKTPPKVKKHLATVCGIIASFGSNSYRILVPKRLYNAYVIAAKKKKDSKSLTKEDMTILYGYLNPRYRACCEPPKRKR